MADEFGFHQRFSSPRHHEGNSLAERAIQTVLEKINSVCHDVANEVDWELEQPHVQLAVNSSFHNSTLFSPYELLLGTTPNQPRELSQRMDDGNERMLLRMKQMFDNRVEAIMNQTLANSSREKHFEKSHKPQQFEVDQLVLARTSETRKSKLQALYFGPFKVLFRFDDNYEVENISGRGEIVKRHTNDLVPFKQRVNNSSGELVKTKHLEKGDKVMVVVRRGRYEGAQIFHGPYIILSKEGDIFKVQAEGKKKILMRPEEDLLPITYEPNQTAGQQQGLITIPDRTCQEEGEDRSSADSSSL